jgi:hypothetical protein
MPYEGVKALQEASKPGRASARIPSHADKWVGSSKRILPVFGGRILEHCVPNRGFQLPRPMGGLCCNTEFPRGARPFKYRIVQYRTAKRWDIIGTKGRIYLCSDFSAFSRLYSPGENHVENICVDINIANWGESKASVEQFEV